MHVLVCGGTGCTASRSHEIVDNLQAVLRDKGLEEDVQAVVSALTIGEKSELTPELKAMYSAAGASHVLALSGLHVGIFSCILLWLFLKHFEPIFY